MSQSAESGQHLLLHRFCHDFQLKINTHLNQIRTELIRLPGNPLRALLNVNTGYLYGHGCGVWGVGAWGVYGRTENGRVTGTNYIATKVAHRCRLSSWPGAKPHELTAVWLRHCHCHWHWQLHWHLACHITYRRGMGMGMGMGHGAWACRLLTAPMSEHPRRFTTLCPFRALSGQIVKYYIDILDSAYIFLYIHFYSCLYLKSDAL